MSGMKKAALRKKVTNYELGEAVFGNDEVVGCALIEKAKTLGMLFMMSELKDSAVDAIRECEQVELMRGERFRSLDLIMKDGTRRRMLFDPMSQYLREIEKQADTHIYLALASMGGEDSMPPTRRRLKVRRIDDDLLMGEPVVVGVGEFCTTTINHWTGTVYVHRFASRAEAEQQLQLNIEADAPFTDLAMN